MNTTMRKALVLDAFYQVLDNRVFRILLGVALLLIVLTFAVGFREEEVVLLFGWKRYTYEQILETFNLPIQSGIPQREGMIRMVQMFFVDNLAGSIGMTFAIAATAFFVPRLLEKGLADGLFSKPISRRSFYLASYFTGVGFVGALSLLLVVGMHIGLLVSSGFSDPGFLWGALTLTYVFAIVHGVSMLIGVYTRSSVAALLLALLFFMVNGCIHGGWAVKEGVMQTDEMRRFLAGEPSEPGEEHDGPPPALVDGFFTTVDVLHYTLPKTTEAAMITELLRAKITRNEPDFFDQESKLRIQRLAEGTSVSRERAAPVPLDLSLATKDAAFIAWLDIEGLDENVSLWLERAPTLKGRGSMSEAMEKRLNTLSGVGRVRRDHYWRRGMSARVVLWIDSADGEPRARRVFVMAGGGGIAALSLSAPPDWVPPTADTAALAEKTGEDRAKALEAAQIDFLAKQFDTLEFDEGGEGVFRVDNDDPTRFVKREFGWSAPWKYNAWFSIGSSFAFTVLILALGIWRIRRIDF